MGVLLCPAHLANINAWTRAQTHAMSHHQFTIKWTLNFPRALVWWCLPLESSPARCVVCSLTIQYPPLIWQASFCACVCAYLFSLLCVSLVYITSLSTSVLLHFRCAQKQRVFLCIVCFAFPFLPYYFFHSVSPLSPWSLAWSHLTSCCTHRNTHWQNESLATSSQSQHFVLPSVVILPFNLSPCPYHAHFFPLSQLSLSLSLYHVP